MKPTDVTNRNGQVMGTAMANYLNDNPSVANQSLQPVPQPSSAAVVNSKSAQADIGNIQTQHQGITQGIKNQSVNIANNTAQKQATDQAKAQQDTQNQQAQQKLAIDKQTADTKAAALGGVSGQQQSSNSSANVVSDIPYGNGQRKVTYQDGTSEILNQTTNSDGSDSYNTQSQDQADLKNQKAQLDKVQQDYQIQSDKVTQTINDIQMGVIPLNAGEQAQIAGLQQQFGALIQQQQLQNTQANGVANIRGYQTGAAEYDPSFQVKTIGSIVTAGINKVADLNIKMASAVADLTQSFKDNDIKAVKEAWDVYNTAATKRQDVLQHTIDQTSAAIKDARDFTYKQQEDERNYQMNLAKFQESVNNDAFSQDLDTKKFNQQQKTDAFDQAYKMEDLALKKRANAIAQQQIAVPSVPMAATGAPDKSAQQAFLATLPPATATAIQELTAYKMNPADFSTRSVGGGISQRQQMLTLAHQYDPTFDENQYAARSAYLKNLQSGTLSQGIVSGNKAINHLLSFTDSVSKLPNGPIGFINSFDNAATLNQGVRKNITTANVEGNGVKDELAKFFKGTGSSDVKSIDDWSKQLNTNASPAAQQGLIQGALNLFSGQFNVLNQQYQSTMGKPADTTIIQPETISKLSDLKNKGYTVDIPGVDYTDKDAYLKYGGGTQESLTNAYNILKQAGLPTTPENILQAAQNL